jgi:glutathione synthase
MLEGQRGTSSTTAVEDLFVERSGPRARVRFAEVRRADPHYSLGEERTLPLAAFDVVFMRKDPPFDLAYYFATQLLGLVDPRATLVVNDPRGLREANEKLYALHFPDLIPESLVTADATRLKAFMETLGGEMIVKPLDGCGGAGVFHVHRGDRNLNAILELSTQNGTRLVMAQRYLAAVREEATSASSSSPASRSAPSPASRRRTSTAATSTSGDASSALRSTRGIARSAGRWRRGSRRTGSISSVWTSSAAS